MGNEPLAPLPLNRGERIAPTPEFEKLPHEQGLPMKSAFYSLCCSALFLFAPAAAEAVHFDRICAAGDALQAFSYPLFSQLVPLDEQDSWKWNEGVLRATSESRVIATSWIPVDENAESWNRRLSVAIASACCVSREAEGEEETQGLQSDKEETETSADEEIAPEFALSRQPYADTETYTFVEERFFVGSWVVSLRYEEDLAQADEEELAQLSARTELWRQRFQAFTLP